MRFPLYSKPALLAGKIIIGIFMLFAFPARAQDRIQPITGVHPRLMLLGGEEETIRQKIKSNEFLARAHRFIMSKSDSYLTAALLQREITGKRMLKTSRAAFMRIYYLSYSWRMTGDKRYAKRANLELRNICSFQNWNPVHFLDAAEMTMAAAIGYDWLYTYLDDDTKQMVRNAILKKGLYESMPETATSKSHYSWLKKKNNWNSVCNTGMAFGALATYDFNPELSQKIINRSIKLVRDVAMQEYMPNGNYPEGYSYWSYGTSFNVMLIDALEKCYRTSFGLAGNPGFMDTPNYILQMSTQNLGCFAYSDCTAGFNLSFPMFWFAGRTGNQSILWGEAQKLAYMDNLGIADDDIFSVRFLPSVLIWASAQTFKEMKKPDQRLYVGQGTTPVAIMRNQWGGKNEIFVGLKGGSCSTNHSHMDIGSFVMYRGANQWVKDLGIQEYYSLEKYGINLGDRSQYSNRWKALRLSKELHNIMIFNGQDQVTEAKASIDASGNSQNFIYASTNLSQVNQTSVSKYLRGVAIVDNSYVMIRDEITNADQFTDIRWAMLTPADVKILDDSTAELSMNGEKMLMKVEGKGIKVHTWSTAPRYSFDEENPQTQMLGFTGILQPGQAAAYTVFFIPEKVQVRTGNLAEISKWQY